MFNLGATSATYLPQVLLLTFMLGSPPSRLLAVPWSFHQVVVSEEGPPSIVSDSGSSLFVNLVVDILSSSVTMYTRASASDYDDWEGQYKNPGWGSKDLLPLLRKVGRNIFNCLF